MVLLALVRAGVLVVLDDDAVVADAVPGGLVVQAQRGELGEVDVRSGLDELDDVRVDTQPIGAVFERFLCDEQCALLGLVGYLPNSKPNKYKIYRL